LKNALVPIYRNTDLYTLFYDQDDGAIYKIPFGKKNSIVSVYLIVIALYISGNFLNGFYQRHHSFFLDTSLVIIGIAITYFTVNKMYQVYYMKEKIRSIILDESSLEECIDKGMKQSRTEIWVIILSFLFAVVTFIAFFTVNSVKPLIFGCLCTSVFLSFIYMKPLKRRKVIKKLQSEK